MYHVKQNEESKFRLLYAEWLLSECSCPVDEIEFLFDNLSTELKKELIKNLKDEICTK